MLRHDTSLMHDARGWSPISEVELRLRAAVGSSGPTTVAEVAAHPAETRFQVNEEYVRAGYGHTIGLVEADYRDQPPARLFHGTIEANRESIRATGLKSMGRDFVHLVEVEDWARRIGARRGPSHVIQIDTAKAQAAGVRFFSVADGMWLSTEVPASSFTSV
jgi:putative RNA 2'-phosphotransferase